MLRHAAHGNARLLVVVVTDRTFIRTGHGNGAGTPRIEVPPVDELPAGEAVAKRPEAAGDERAADGTIAGSSLAKELGARGGAAKRGRTALAASLGLGELAEDADFAHYQRAAENFRRHQVAELAATVGGGKCGAAPASIIATAALQRAASAFLMERAAATGSPELFKTASRLGNDSRQNLLAAHSLCALEAKAALAAEPDPLFKQQQDFQRRLAERQERDG